LFLVVLANDDAVLVLEVVAFAFGAAVVLASLAAVLVAPLGAVALAAFALPGPLGLVRHHRARCEDATENKRQRTFHLHRHGFHTQPPDQ
jgi:hypothetical protein